MPADRTVVHRFLPPVLSLNAGFVDTAGFLMLQGLFTAHVTGNFVTLGAALVHGSSGILAKMLALPVFCAVVVATRLADHRLTSRGLPVLKLALFLKLMLLIVGAVLAIRFAPFQAKDGGLALITGMVLVSAMAIQNAAHRVHFASAPPTTLMTGTTTQIMIDLADLIQGVPAEARALAKSRLGRMSISVGSFAVGCGAAAILYSRYGSWCFVVPPMVAAYALALQQVPRPTRAQP